MGIFLDMLLINTESSGSLLSSNTSEGCCFAGIRRQPVLT
jgi:hypothetical protein